MTHSKAHIVTVQDKVEFVGVIGMWVVRFSVDGKNYVQAYNTQEAALECWVDLRTPESMEEIIAKRYPINA